MGILRDLDRLLIAKLEADIVRYDGYIAEQEHELAEDTSSSAGELRQIMLDGYKDIRARLVELERNLKDRVHRPVP